MNSLKVEAKEQETLPRQSREEEHRQFSSADIPAILQQIFNEFDRDGNKLFSKREFTKVVQSLIELIGGDVPILEDVDDLFNLIDVNGDEAVDRKELTSLLTAFFRILQEKQIEVEIN